MNDSASGVVQGLPFQTATPEVHGSNPDLSKKFSISVVQDFSANSKPVPIDFEPVPIFFVTSKGDEKHEGDKKRRGDGKQESRRKIGIRQTSCI